MRHFFTVCLVTLLISCNDEVNGDVLIRIENTSEFSFENIKVGDRSELREFEALASGEVASYQKFNKAYSYAYIELVIDEETYFIQPTDFVGEKELDSGKYTYSLSADNPTSPYGRLSLELKKD